MKEHKDLWNYGHLQYKKLTSWIVKMIAIDSQPFSIVQDTSFLQLLSNVCQLYAVPSCNYFAEKVIPEMFSAIKTQLMKDIHSDGDSLKICLHFLYAYKSSLKVKNWIYCRYFFTSILVYDLYKCIVL